MIHFFDYVIIALYFAVIVAIGIATRGRQRDIDDYFTAGRGLGGPLGVFFVGVSIAPISGLSLLALPSVFYSYGWRYVIILPSLALLWWVMHALFLPRLFARPLRHSYDLIEDYFGPRVRTAASAMFVALRIGWMAALIYAPTLVILTMLGLGRDWFWPVNITIGVSCTAYAVLGGIRGVIFTDAIQTLVMMLGIALVVGFVALNLPVPVTQALAELTRNGTLATPSFALSFTESFTVWVVVIGWTLGNLSNYMADQMAIQRFLATGSERGAKRCFAINVAGSAVTFALLAAIGIMLRVWYGYRTDPMLPVQADRVMPYFVARELPSGISGLLMAAILAATMSAMTSGINALSGSLTNDFLVRFGRARTPQELLRFARWSSCLIGLAATAVAGTVDRFGTIFQIQLRVLSSFQGPLLGCVALIVLRVKARPAAVIAGLIIGAVTGAAITATPADPLWVVPGACGATMLATLVITRVLRGSGEGVGDATVKA